MIRTQSVDQFHDATVAAIITSTVVLAVAIIGLIGVMIKLAYDTSKMRRSTEIVKHQVTNDHDTNLRVENDQRHFENAQRLKKLENGQRRTSYGLSKLTRSVTRIEDALQIERTIDPKRTRR